SAQIREILISESAWEEMTCLFAPSLAAVARPVHEFIIEFFMN
ncbi:dibenzothiophene desulfurase, partial [Klebsiella pneumoniae]